MTLEDWIFHTRRRIGRADYTFTTFLPSTRIDDASCLDVVSHCGVQSSIENPLAALQQKISPICKATK
jgi:hypothetical protein